MATSLKITNVDISGQPYGGSQLGTGPLSNLYKQPSSTGTNFRYPSDLGTNQDNNSKNHWVTFSIYDVVPGSYAAKATELSITGSGAFNLAGAGVTYTAFAAAAGKLVGGNAGLAQSIIQNTAAIAAGGAIGTMLLSGLAISPQLTNIIQTISLYMPETLAVDYQSHYEELNLSADLGPTVSTVRGIANAGDSATANMQPGAVGNDASISPGYLAAAQNLGTIGGVNVTNLSTLMLKAQGLSINPQVQMIYRGTGLREFQLAFTFTPKSQDEAHTVNSIIQQFRFYSSPSLSNADKSSTGQTSLFLVPPSQFRVDFYVNGNKSSILPQYGNCVLTSMNVNDAPNGFAAFTDGSMVQRTLNLNFKELDILTRDYFSVDGGMSSSTGAMETRR